jgi:N-acyl-D-aspartate/D-glutamate deacylase
LNEKANADLWRIGKMSFVKVLSRLLVGFVGILLFASGSFTADKYDVIIKGGKIVDGTGKPGFIGDVAIKGDKIVAVGKVSGEAATLIDAKGLIVCPGFVDSHSHADAGILQYPKAESYIMQGITMVIAGNCGHSAAPAKDLSFGDWMSKVEKTPISINMAMLVGFTSNIRGLVMKGDDFMRGANEDEIEKEKAYVEEAMKNGAFGISTGLSPGLRNYSSDDELIESAKVAQKYGGWWSAHTRWQEHDWYTEDPKEFGYGINYAPPGEVIAGRFHGLVECLELSRKANNIPQMIAHLNPGYLIPEPHPEYLDAAAARATIDEIIEPARRAGQKVYHNVIAASGYQNTGPGPGSQSTIIGTFQLGYFVKDYRRSGGLKIHATPDWLKQMTEKEFVEQLKTKEFREKMKKVIYSGRFKFKMVHPLADPYWMDCFRILTHKNQAYVGRTIGEIARKRSPGNIKKAVYEESFNTLFDILVEDPEATWADILDKREFSASHLEFLKDAGGMPCIDGGISPADLNNVVETHMEGKVKRIPGMPFFNHGEYQNAAPKAYGTFPLYIDTFVKKYKGLTLEEAIKKATSVPAQEVLGLKDRGVLSPEAYADVVVFNFDNIGMTGDYLKPNSPPDGIEYVFVNGKLTYKDKKHTGEKSGKLIRHNY